jgi:serine/threonine-protein kinase SRPK3
MTSRPLTGCWADKIDDHFTDLIQSPAVRAPEVCIGAGWGKAADIWSLGCLVRTTFHYFA